MIETTQRDRRSLTRRASDVLSDDHASLGQQNAALKLFTVGE